MKQIDVSYLKVAAILKMPFPKRRRASDQEAGNLQAISNQLLSKLTVGFSQAEGSRGHCLLILRRKN